MTSIPNSLKSTGPTTKMMPGGSRKVCVLNGSRQIDQVTKGKWTTLKMLPESGLPEGIYQLGEVARTNNGKDASFTGQVLFNDSKVVYRPPDKGVVEHSHSTFAELEAKGEKIIGSHSHTVAYANNKGVVSNTQTASITQPRVISKSHGASV